MLKYSSIIAGSQTRGVVNSLILQISRRKELPTHKLRSRNWSEFTFRGAPKMDFVFTDCGQAVAESCPGQPKTAHWGLEDPALATAGERTRLNASTPVFAEQEARIKLFKSSPLESSEKS